jgi:hypothetical protein
MRGKNRRLEEALECSFFTDQHAAVLAMMLTTIDPHSAQIDQLTARRCRLPSGGPIFGSAVRDVRARVAGAVG